MKLSLRVSFFVTLLISIIIYIFIDNSFSFLFIVELFYLILLALEKIILPVYGLNKSRITKNEYYREELSNYSPFINAILLNRNIFDADIIVAMFLYLEDKGYDGSKIYKNDNLLPHEIDFIQKQDFYLSYFKSKDYSNKDLIRFKKLIIDDMIKENILINEKRYLNIDKIDLISFLFIMIHFGLIINFFPNKSGIYYIVIELFYNIMLFLIYFCNNILNLSIIKLLTPKGENYYGKLLASRKFLKEFSVISSRNIEEKSLWNSYLYNAILFNLKGKLDADAKEYYKRLLSRNNYYINKKCDTLYSVLVTVILLCPWIFLYVKGDGLFRYILQNFINGGLIIHFANKSVHNQILNNLSEI